MVLIPIEKRIGDTEYIFKFPRELTLEEHSGLISSTRCAISYLGRTPKLWSTESFLFSDYLAVKYGTENGGSLRHQDITAVEEMCGRILVIDPDTQDRIPLAEFQKSILVTLR